MEILIRKLECFGPLAEEDKALLRSVPVRERKVGARADIIAEGESPNDVHLILSGFACRYKLIRNGRRQIVAYLLPGDFCDLHVYNLGVMDHGIATLSYCSVVDLPRESILKLLERPSLSRSLEMATLVDEAILREWVTNIGARRAELRIAHLFCELHARMKAVGLVKDETFELPVTQQELAETTGLSTVHINRSLQSLRADRLIELKSGTLHIPDIRKLKEISGFMPTYLHLEQAGVAITKYYKYDMLRARYDDTLRGPWG